MNWTESQIKAIEFQNSDVLVSAAAGSGKTSTLTERVLRAVLDPDSPTDIRRMLIVTYTKKAAYELRKKVKNRLEEYLKNDPGNQNVRRQLKLLPSADISTIHSFYVKILQKNFASLGLPPKIGAADETEFLQLRKTILNDLIESYCGGEITGEYEIDDPYGFFASLAGGRKDSELSDILSELYTKASSYKEYLSYYKNCAATAKAAATDFAASPYYAYIRAYIKRQLILYRDKINGLFEKYAGEDKFIPNYSTALESCLDYIKMAFSAYDKKDYQGAREFALNKPDIPGFKSGDPVYSAVSQKVKKDFTDLVGKTIPGLYSFTDAQISEICLKTSEVYLNIYKLLSNFDRLFIERKLKYKKLDYNDLERFAYRLLCDDNGRPTPEAISIGEKYDAIFIDEYQDVNSAQDAIFSAISRNDRFMVGDIKQSIYGFRGSEPQLFSGYRKRAESKKPGDQTPDVIFLSDNFRCGKPVVDFTNMIFSKLFGADADEIPYSEDDALVFSKKANVREDVKVNVYIPIGDGKSLKEAAEKEKEYIAKSILDLLQNGKDDNGAPIKPDDIAVLCRTEDICTSVEKTLKEYGIPVSVAVKKGFFNAPEVILAVSLLTAVDNPMRDVPLASVMRSPIFGFTADELAMIRINTPDAAFYEAVEAYAETDKGEKCRKFLDRFGTFRKKSRKLPLEKFIRFIYGQTAIMTLAFNKKDKGNSETRKANLRRLYDLARNFSAGAYGSLSDFVTFCDNLIKNNKSISVPASEEKGCVTVQTIHKSKGLEYTAVFLCSINTNFRKGNNKTVSDRSLGTAVTTFLGDDPVKGPIYFSISQKSGDNAVREEMRLLYVALTRAKKYLFVTGKNEKRPETGGKVSLERIMECKCYQDLICLCVPEGETGCSVFTVDESMPAELTGAEDAVLTDITTYDAVFGQKAKDNFAFVYPHIALSSVPNKVAVSKLYPAMLDSDETVCDIDPDSAIPLILPDADDEEEKATAADRGTATHMFMQFCDFDKASADVKEEAARLVEKGFLSEETVKLIYTDEIAGFFRSGLYERMNDAKKNGRLFFREFRFNIGLDASEFTNDKEMKKKLANETLLVQGVVDCFFEEADGTITVCDYKTDRIGKSEEAKAAFAERHRMQLEYYKKALERITKKTVGRLVLYSFCIGGEVDV